MLACHQKTTPSSLFEDWFFGLFLVIARVSRFDFGSVSIKPVYSKSMAINDPEGGGIEKGTGCRPPCGC